MRTYPFWDRLVDSHFLNNSVCTGMREGFLDVLEQLGPRCSVESFNVQQGSFFQADLFENTEEKKWVVIFIPLSAPHQAELVQKLLVAKSRRVAWIFLEKVPNDVPKDLEVLNVQVPTLQQWQAVLKKFLPQFGGQVVVPVDLEQAARFLKNLSLTGQYLGERDVILEGTAWEKFEILLSRDQSEVELPISDLSHVAHCLEVIHQKSAFPGKWVSFMPKFFEQKMTKPFAFFLNEKVLPHYIELLQSIQNLDPVAGSKALSQWLYLVKGFFKPNHIQ